MGISPLSQSRIGHFDRVHAWVPQSALAMERGACHPVEQPWGGGAIYRTQCIALEFSGRTTAVDRSDLCDCRFWLGLVDGQPGAQGSFGSWQMRTALGLIGFPLTVSFSPGWFAEKFRQEHLADWTYETFPLADIGDFPALLKSRSDLGGLNVTIPHKQTIIPFLDELDPAAARIGAVNTIKIEHGGRLIGYNTDGPAFQDSLVNLLGEDWSGHALILGNGGAAHAVKDACSQLDIPFTIASRKEGAKTISYTELHQGGLTDFSLIINTTPLGMSPHVDACPDIPYEDLGSNHFLYDLIYSPAETCFLKMGNTRGARTKNGLEMLYLQAEKSWQIWMQT